MEFTEADKFNVKTAINRIYQVMTEEMGENDCQEEVAEIVLDCDRLETYCDESQADSISKFRQFPFSEQIKFCIQNLDK